MVDSEIIKALECLTGKPFKCRECPYSPRYQFPLCQQTVAKDALSLINQLQKNQDDIDKFARTLSYGRKFKGKFINDFEDILDFITKEKSEARREFAERLKENLHIAPTVYNSHFGRMIDNILKEMESESDAV